MPPNIYNHFVFIFQPINRMAGGPIDYTKTRALPGFGHPVNYVTPKMDPGYIGDPFPNALEVDDLGEGRAALTLTTLREFLMLQLMNLVTDKPDWNKKVFDEEITEKWKAEALSSGKDVTEAMLAWCIHELKDKAAQFEADPNGIIVIYNGDVVKSDKAVSEETRLALEALVKPLEDVPSHLKDWHPGSNQQVLDLVHPSLFPLVYGRSKILPIGAKVTTLKDCIKRCGEGEVLPALNTHRPEHARRQMMGTYSSKFQWLPCEVDISGEKAKITTYINNLHPGKHGDLYRVIEDVITAALPLWGRTLAPMNHSTYRLPQRIKYETCEYDPDPEYGPETDGPQQLPGEDEDDYSERREQWYTDTRVVVLPEPGEYEQPVEPEPFSLRETYGNDNIPLQIIVKLANIGLTPDRPEYPGGTWHVEGKLNEHICATAIYYYSSENITTSTLAFRQQSEQDSTIDIGYQQDHHDWLPAVFGCHQNGPAVQVVGSVETKQGRMITFPNILQHQVQPFKLQDPTKPGHRKILALFLVDPNVRCISTANVPCQRLDWWREETLGEAASAKAGGALSGGVTGLSELPLEIQDHVFGEVDEFPISLEQAKAIRSELMEERKKFVLEHQQKFEEAEFSLCEH